MEFTKAERRKAKLRLALTGPSGSGKTWGALVIASVFGGKTAVIDTEKGSASLYTHLLDFDVLELGPPFTPERFLEAMHAAEKAGYTTLIIDSITPEWNGVGGCLELVTEVARAKYKGNQWAAFDDITPRHRKFLDALIQSPMHIIATMRSKTETAQVEDGGRKKVVKLGMKAEQRDGAEYEFTTVLDLIHDGHYATASKDRTGIFSDKNPQPITAETGRALMAWLESGADAPPPPPAAAAKGKKAVELMDPDLLAADIKSIEEATTMAELKKAWTKAKEAAPAKDTDARKAIATAGNKRMAELQPSTERAAA